MGLLPTIAGIKRAVVYSGVFFLTGIFNLLIKLVPFKRLVRLMSNYDTEPPDELLPKQRARLRSVRRAIFTVSKRTPWRSKCFEQALTAGFLLRLAGISHGIYFGLNDDDNALKAHAWLKVGDMMVTGFDTGLEFKTVSAFYYISKRQSGNLQ